MGRRSLGPTTMSTSKLNSGLQMWWHADLPAAAADPDGSQSPPEFAREDWAAPTGDGADLLEWILPTLSADRSRRDGQPDGGPRRSLRRQLRDEG